MWTVISVVAVIVMLLSFFNGRNAIWGGATLGLLVGIVLSVVRLSFDWGSLWNSIAVGACIGAVLEAMSTLLDHVGGRRTGEL